MNKTLQPLILCLVAVLAACGGSEEEHNVTSTVDGTTTTVIPRDQQVTSDTPSTNNDDDTIITVTQENENNGTTDSNTGSNDNPIDNNTGSGPTPPPVEEPESPPLGQSFFIALCASCHGENGEGTPNGNSLIKNWDETALRNKIDNDMPPSDPVACSGLCAQTTTDYIIDAFTPQPNNPPPPPPPNQPYAIISTPDNLTDYAPHTIALEARFTGIAGTPLIQWYLDNQQVAQGVTYDASFVLPGRHALQLVITGQDNVQVIVNEMISIMAQDHTVDECSPPIEFYAVRIGPNMVDNDCTQCHTSNGIARNSGLVFESLAVRGGLTNNYQSLARYARFPGVLLDSVAGRGHGGGERLNLGDTNSALYEDLTTFLSIEAQTPANCLVQ